MFQRWNFRTIASTGFLGTLAFSFVSSKSKKNKGKGKDVDCQIPCKVREYCKELSLSDDCLRTVMANLDRQMTQGLNPSTKPKASTKCWTTYVQDLPTGKECGNYLALDLGGTNFRVLVIRLNKEQFDMKSKIYAVPPEIMTGTGEQLFDHIAECLACFTKEHRCNRDKLPLGFTFSFPCEQLSLEKGILQRWTKGFNASGVVGEDVVCLLKKAIAKRDDLDIDVTAILNDTTGTLMSCAWKNNNTKMGVILGTGTNACYVEHSKNIPGFDGDKCKPVIINIEWGAFGDNGELAFIQTKYDKVVDEKSLNPGQQIFEKMISGMYLGEIVRLVLVELTKANVLFEGCLSKELDTYDSFQTCFLSEIEGDKKGCNTHCQKILNKLNIRKFTDQDCANIRYICECVTRRAAYLASAGVATVLNRMKSKQVTVGVDGSLYRYHPYFHDIMTEKIAELVDPDIKFQLMLSEDGSGRGAALVAAAAKAAEANE